MDRKLDCKGETLTLKEQLILHEGRVLKPYNCTVGHRTIGVGHNYDANPLPEDIAEYLKKHGFITNEMADRLLDADIEQARKGCLKLYPGFNDFPCGKQKALIDLCFNLGYGGLKSFINTNRHINAGNWSRAAANLRKSLWAQQVGQNRVNRICKLLEG
ncbi:MAG: glycoside hydrolase family protein [Anaerovoracaceae bacterium]